MGLLGKLGLGGSDGNLKMPITFRTIIRRKTTTQEVTFDIDVKGYFVGKAGKPNFISEEITVVGIPGLNIRSFLPRELDEIKKYALQVEYPKLIGKKPPA